MGIWSCTTSQEWIGVNSKKFLTLQDVKDLAIWLTCLTTVRSWSLAIQCQYDANIYMNKLSSDSSQYALLDTTFRYSSLVTFIDYMYSIPHINTDHKRKGAYALFKKRFKVALGCMAIRIQTELMIRRVQFIRRTKEAVTQAACAENTRGYNSEYGNSWFNNRENDDAYYMFRSYNNCYYSSSELVTDEEDEL